MFIIWIADHLSNKFNHKNTLVVVMTTLTTNEWEDDAGDDVVIIYDFKDNNDGIDDIDQRTNDCEDDAGDDKEDSDGE